MLSAPPPPSAPAILAVLLLAAPVSLPAAEPRRAAAQAARGMSAELAVWAPDRGRHYAWFENDAFVAPAEMRERMAADEKLAAASRHLRVTFPEGYLAAGYLCVSVRNGTASPRTATQFALAGRPLEALRTERTVTWWRMLPASLPPGGVGEVMIRLRSPLLEAATVRIGFDDGSEIETTVAPQPAPLRIETIGFTPAMDEVFLVVDRLTDARHDLSRVWLDGEEITERCRFLDPDFSSGVSPVTIRPAKPLAHGSYHNYRVATADGVTVACTVRTYDGWVPLGTYGYDEFGEFARNGCNGHISFRPHGKPDLDTHAALGMRAVSLVGDQPPARELVGHPGVFAYQPMDEPDVQDYFQADQSWPVGERVGYHAMEMERRFQLYRKADPRALGLLTVDLTYKPANYYIYAPIPDIVNPDCYTFVIGADVNMVREAVETCRYAAGPRPVTFTFQSQFEEPTDPAARAKLRFPRPPLAAEQRLMLHYAIGAGARGLFNYHHHSEPYGASRSRGTGEFPDQWREIGRTYRALDRVAPLLASAHPTRLAAASDPKVLVSTLLAGPSAVLLVVVNEDYEQQAKACRFNRKRDLTVELPKVPWLQTTCAWRVTETGFEPAEMADGKLKIGTLDVADVYLLGERPDLIGPLEARARDREARLAAALLDSWRREQAQAAALADLHRRLEGEFDDCVVAGEGVAAYGVEAERFWNPRGLPSPGFEFGQGGAVPDQIRGARWQIAVPAGEAGEELALYAQATAWGQPARFRLTDPAGKEVFTRPFDGSPVSILRFKPEAAGTYELSFEQDGPGPKGGQAAHVIYVVPADRNPPAWKR